MALTPSDIDNLPTFTTAQLLKLCEWKIVQVTNGAQAFGADGRQLTNADLPGLYDQRDKLKEEIAAESAGESGGGNILVNLTRAE